MNLAQFFEQYGLTVEAERRLQRGWFWYEVIWQGELSLQIDDDVTLAQFEEWLKAPDDFQPHFFIASDKSAAEFAAFLDVFWDAERQVFRPVPRGENPGERADA